MLDEKSLELVESGLSEYALDSLPERMISAILEREDEGYIRWEPRAIYERVQDKNPDLYPTKAPHTVMDHFLTEEFAQELAARRSHRYMTRLPSAMLQDTIGRRLVDLVLPILFDSLEAKSELVTPGEARRILKDALAYVDKNDAYLRPPADSGLDQAPSSSEALTLEQAMKLIGVAGPDRKEIIAKALAMSFITAAEQMNAEEAEIVDVESD